MTRSRARNARKTTAWLVAAAVVAMTAGWMALDATTAETAPAPRLHVSETPVSGPAGGIVAELDVGGYAAVFATRTPDGGVSIECTDPETAAAMVYGVVP